MDGIPRQLSEEMVKAVMRTDLVIAVGDDQKRGQAADPAADELQKIEGRVVHPVRVLDHDGARRRRKRELGKERREDAFPVGSFVHCSCEWTLRLLRHVV